MEVKVTVISTFPDKKEEAIDNLRRKIVAGSCIGGMKETQAMINFAAKQNITSHIELIPIHYVNTAMERLLKSFFSFFDFSIQNLNRGLSLILKKEESIGSDDLRKIRFGGATKKKK
ncbi:hypothetical protein F8388_019392 [Cannabis sativa]|uniref:Uncharacterized protein n=1 Tax=Cannabis sativa TaxID=3483 RepID=A0A7J6FFP5_CANSA|nr:hypothetical protein F8388_019392 [Cannabis sativa]